MTTTYMDPETMEDLTEGVIVPVFPGDHDQRTSGVGFLTYDGTHPANIISNPEQIMAVAFRLIELADEIAESQASDIEQLSHQVRALGPGATLGDLVSHRERMQQSGVVSLDEKRGRNDPADS